MLLFFGTFPNFSSYYNSCGPLRENLYNAVKHDREAFTSNVSDNDPLIFVRDCYEIYSW